MALVLLKNIEKQRTSGIPIKKIYLIPEIYSYKVPPAILKKLCLRAPGEVVSRRTKRSK
jgi:hypothetical protein